MSSTPIIDSVIEYLESRGCKTNVPYTSKNDIKPKKVIFIDEYYKLRKDSFNNKNILKNYKKVNQNT